jgi:4,5-dihydroxyphthalate decarboxylase
MLPFLDEALQTARDLMGEDFWPYGFAQNRHVIEYFLRHHHAQGLSARALRGEELFHSSTLETYRI